MERLILWHRLVPSRDDADDPSVEVRWARTVQRRLVETRGVLLCSVGATVAAAFDPADVNDVMEVALALLEESEVQDPKVDVSVGLAAGAIREADDQPAFPFPSGSAIDRAQLLANRARVGELVLDREARKLADKRYLFSRTVGMGTAGLRGDAVDRKQPRRADSRVHVRHLGWPPIPPSAEPAAAALRERLRAGARHRVVLRAERDAGGREWVEALAQELEPPLLLRVEGVPGGLEPLGSLRLALVRRWGDPEGVRAATRAAAVDRRSVDTLTRIGDGRAVEREPTVEALRALLAAQADEGTPWIVLDPMAEVDTATIDAVLTATSAGGPDALVIARLGPEEQEPPALSSAQDVVVVTLSTLSPDDALAVARVVLGGQTDENVVRRVATTGGSTPLGIVEAARTMVSAGDIVWNGRGFGWRVSPRGGIKAIATESLVEERLGALDATALRLLAVTCVAPSGAAREVLRAVARADGLGDDEIEAGVESLRAGAFLAPYDPWQPTSDLLRATVLQGMQPTRLSELSRLVARAMQTLGHPDGDFQRATVGWYLSEGGHDEEGARALIESGRAAQLAGFTRAAVRLAAAAVQMDETNATRRAATLLTRAARQPRPATDSQQLKLTPPPDTVVAPADTEETETLVARLVSALVRKDFESADRFIDIAIAEGHDRGAADRVRSVASLVRGDLPAAMSYLGRARPEGSDDRAEARWALAHALVVLHAGDPLGAVRAALRALSRSRTRRDPRGEAAALHTLALCYRALARDRDADLLEEASPA